MEEQRLTTIIHRDRHGKMKDNEFLWGSSDVVSWFEGVRNTKQGRIDDVLEKWYQLPGGPETAE